MSPKEAQFRWKTEKLLRGFENPVQIKSGTMFFGAAVKYFG